MNLRRHNVWVTTEAMAFRRVRIAQTRVINRVLTAVVNPHRGMLIPLFDLRPRHSFPS